MDFIWLFSWLNYMSEYGWSYKDYEMQFVVVLYVFQYIFGM